MRIAFIAQPFDRLCPPVQGGSLAIWIYQIARICARRGTQTTVIANHGGLLKSQSTRYEEVDYIYTPTARNRLGNRLARFARRFRSAALLPPFAEEDLGYAAAAARHSRRLGCEVIHIINYFQFVPIVRRIHPACKIALHMQCEWLTQLDPAAMEQHIACSDLVVGCSEYITRKIAGKFPRYAARCVTVPNAAGLAPENDRSTLDPNYVLFVGRVSPEKGVHLLVRAFHDVLKRFPEARLHVAGGFGSAPLELLVGLSDEPHVTALRVFYESTSSGNGDPYPDAVRREAGAEIDKRIFFEGRIDHSQTESFYKRAAVLVNPSLSESFGMSLVEAMMQRVPVVASRVGGMPYIVDPGVTGFLVEPADGRGLADAICEVLSDPDRARRMGDAGRRRVIEKFSWDKATDLLLQHYSSVLK